MIQKTIITIFTLLSLSNVALAASDNGIAIVNVDKVKMETKAGKSIATQLTKLQNDLKDKVAKLQKDFYNQKQDLDKQKNVLSKEAFTKKETEFNNKVNDSQKEIQTEANNIEVMQQNSLNEFNNVALGIIADLAKEGNYLQVFPAEIVIYSSPKVDITSQVIAGIDKKIDTITLKTPEDTAKENTKKK